MSLIPALCSACGSGGGSGGGALAVQDLVLCDVVAGTVVGSAVAVYEYDTTTGLPVGSPTFVIPGTTTPYTVLGALQPCDTGGGSSGPVTVNQGTSPWVVSMASTTITGTVATTVSGSDTPADTRVNPTTNVPTTAYNEVFNGTTWDRLRSGSALGSLLVNNPTAANLMATVAQGTSPWVVSLASTTVNQGTSPWVVSGTVTSNQGTSPWVVGGTVTALQGTSPWVVSLASTTVTGTVAVTQSTSPWVVSGTVTANQGTSPWVVTGSVTTTIAGGDTPADARANPTTNLATTGFNEVFNGATWDRMRSGSALGSVLVNNPTAANLQVTASQAAGSNPWTVNGTVTANQGTSPWVVSLASTTITGTVAVTQSTSPWVVSGTVTSNITGSDTPADARSNPTQNVATTGFNEVFNGLTWDRMRAGTALGSVLVNNPTAANFNATVVGTVTANQGTSPWVVSLASTTVNQGTSPWVVSGTVTANQGTSPWVVSLASTTITGTVSVTGSVSLTGSGPTTSLNAQSTVQNGTALDDGGMHTHHTIVVITSAGVSSGTVVFQVSQDNTNWFNAVTFSTTVASNVASADVVGAFRYCRAAITVAITGGTVTATVASV